VATEFFAAQRLNPLEISDWDARISRQPDFTFFHGAAWAKVLAETYGYKSHYFFSGQQELPDLLLPLMEVKSWLTGARGIALPFTDECEPLGMDKNALPKLFEAAVQFGKKRGWKYIELRGGKTFLPESPASVSFFGHDLDLVTGAEKLFENLDSSIRRAIRKAEKEGVITEVLQDEKSMCDFYSLQCRTRKKHGLPPQPYNFFLNIHRHILSQNQGMIVLARHHGRAVAAAVYFYLGGRAIYKFGASDESQQHLRANNLVMWTAIRWLAQQGATQLNLGRTSLANEGLRRFKLAWGAVEKKIDYVKFDLRENRFVIEQDEASGWHNRIFRMLPISLSRMTGQILYKHWA
jgi:hypothetical protein